MTQETAFAILKSLAEHIDSLETWLVVQSYFAQMFMKLGTDLEPLRRYAADLVRPFEQPGDPLADSNACRANAVGRRSPGLSASTASLLGARVRAVRTAAVSRDRSRSRARRRDPGAAGADAVLRPARHRVQPVPDQRPVDRFVADVFSARPVSGELAAMPTGLLEL